MHSMHPTPVSSWRARAREFLVRLFRPRREPTRVVYWADMMPIDFEGEDSSLRENHLRLMK